MATSHKYACTAKEWTYGAEHEWSDWSLDTPLPEGFALDTADNTMVNSNGIANDPKGQLYRFGGEICTVPTTTVDEQVAWFDRLRALLPDATVNYRSNLHIHIRVPGLKDDLKGLIRVQRYIHENMPFALEILTPLPAPMLLGAGTAEEYEGAQKRWRRRKVSHRTFLTPQRLARQYAANSPKEFFDAEVPWSKSGKPMWHAQPRVCVNLRQLLQTDTVEFRHFPGTLDAHEFHCCVLWCRRFLECALDDKPLGPVVAWARTHRFPTFPSYVHWMELRYRETVHDGTRSRAQIKAAIRAILEGRFDEYLGRMSREHK